MNLNLYLAIDLVWCTSKTKATQNCKVLNVTELISVTEKCKASMLDHVFPWKATVYYSAPE